tara:strand:+ start:407 stop:616 length:210 start_codon:yes stop_codon:yes gene_type:complete
MTKFFEKGKRIRFPHIVDDEKKEVYFLVESGYPAVMAITPIMEKCFPSDFKGYISSPDTWVKMKKRAIK